MVCVMKMVCCWLAQQTPLWVELPLPPGEEWSAELVCVYDGGVVAVSARGAVVGWPSFPQGTVGACHGRAAIGSEDRFRSAFSLQAVRVVGDSVC